MREPEQLFVVEVQGGHALPDAIRLHAGRELPGTSIGRKGRWYVAGPGVRDLHADIMFDGANLHVRSSSPEYPLHIEGRPVSSGWTLVRAPCRISMGSVALAYVALPTADASLEATRIDEAAFDASATRMNQELASATGAPVDVPPQLFPVRHEKPKRLEALKAQWKRAPPSRKAMFVLLALALLVVHLTAKNRGRQAASPSGLDAIAATSPVADAAPPVPLQTGSPAASTALSPLVSTTGKTLERLAVEAVANNAYSQAVARYDALAQHHPDEVSYREAARILRSKLTDAGGL